MSQPLVALIDADAAHNAELARELGRHALRVEAFTDPNEVMARKDELPELIVLCIDPKRTGWAVCNRLRKSSTLKTVPLVIVSAEATEKDFEDHKKLKTRAEDYLHKPFVPAVLMQKVAALLGLPDSAGEEVEISLDDPEELAIDDENMVMEDVSVASDDTAGMSFEEEGATRIGDMRGIMQIDGEVNAEADAAFAAIGLDDPAATTAQQMVPPADTPTPRPLARVQPVKRPSTNLQAVEDSSPFPLADPLSEAAPLAAISHSPSEDLDLGLDEVAQQVTRSAEASRSASPQRIVTSAPQPAHDTAAHEVRPGEIVSGQLEELRRDRDRLAHELEELRARPAAAAKAEASAGFSREREFLNLREIINKKEKELLDLKDAADSKERQILDGKDKIRELERHAGSQDEKLLATERELVAAREKIEALHQDKEQAVERERQVKARLEDAQATSRRYEGELDGLQKKQAADLAAMQAELQETKARHSAALTQQIESSAAHLRDVVEQHELEKTAASERTQAERAQLEAEHAAAMSALREGGDRERERLSAEHAALLAETEERHRNEMEARESQAAQTQATLVAEHTAHQQERDQRHADELAGLRARQATELKVAERKHEGELAERDARHQAELQAADDRRLQELAGRDEQHRAAEEQLAADQAGELERLHGEHAEALRIADERRQNELAAMQAAHQAALGVAQAEHEQKLESELRAAKESHSRKLQALEESHADLKAGMQGRHAQQLEELKATHASQLAEYDEAVRQRDGMIADAHSRIAELERTLTGEQEEAARQAEQLEQLGGKLSATLAEVAERDQRLGERAQRIAELEQESAGYQDQILKAYQRIKSDESIVSRAKKALAIALTLLDESAPDEKDEASS